MQKRVEKSGSDACAFHVKICVSITLNLMTGLEKPVTEARVGRIIKIVLQWGADDLFSANQKVFLKLPTANQRQENHPHTQLLPSQVRKRLSWSKKIWLFVQSWSDPKAFTSAPRWSWKDLTGVCIADPAFSWVQVPTPQEDYPHEGGQFIRDQMSFHKNTYSPFQKPHVTCEMCF